MTQDEMVVWHHRLYGRGYGWPTSQFKSVNSSALSFLHSPTLTSIHDHWKAIALTRQTFVGKVMSLLFNILSRLVNFPSKE